MKYIFQIFILCGLIITVYIKYASSNLFTSQRIIDGIDTDAKDEDNILPIATQLLPTVSSPFVLTNLSSSLFGSSSLNAIPINVRNPFFQGWLVRGQDISRNTSFVVIMGSFSSRKQSKYSQHYLFCSVCSMGLVQHEEIILNGDEVKIRCLKSTTGRSSAEQPLNICWDAGKYGHVRFTNNECIGKIKLNGRLSIKFNTFKRLPWTTTKKKKKILHIRRKISNTSVPVVSKGSTDIFRAFRDGFEGPEGWLGALSSTSKLLPCRYFVHSVGSVCKYRIKSYRALSTPTVGGLWRRLRGVVTGTGRSTILSGEGYAHIEGNHGSYFPKGWIWSQSIAADNTASFSLVLGKFSIAGLEPTNTILYIRRRNGEVLVFRTTDFASVRNTSNRTSGSLSLVASSIFKQYRAHLTIQTIGTARDAFHAHVQVPTASGFNRSPGCWECYTATATLRLESCSSGKDCTEKETLPEEVYEFPLTALEYGGSFVDMLEGISAASTSNTTSSSGT